ncbi:MAG: cupin domain-containing protein [Xanthomonadales bacterium]|nr:cupin domain-containing protein [Xanthomonadales bacterium]
MEIGERLRTVRESHGLSQRELARRVGVTNSTISLIEQDKVSPSISSLKKVLDGIPISLARFFTMDLQREEDSPFYQADQLPDIGSGDIHYYLVGENFPSPKLCMLREIMPPGSDTGEEMLSHEGEEGGFVLAGQVEIQIGQQRRTLGPGEAYYFDTRLPHRFRNAGDEDVVIVSASTPRTF